ncbi:integrator complex subunit 15 isoform X2 [Plodia interpunctella]|uniref:integrator complex subunit 15 isoform X2 n=1 Tax=Plodia interpunctella TaxID=58824 RepID=UPI002368D611|nr:integrator complex subunit 15 isoform X2 [Plodia interpunctella]
MWKLEGTRGGVAKVNKNHKIRDMSISDLKHTLRKYEFPSCAKEALGKVEQILIGRVGPSTKQIDIAMDIISEFVFCDNDRRGGRRSTGLSHLQQLQLIDIICDYLSECTNETTKNTVFLSLFGGMESQRRLKILCILASMAVSASSTPVLLAVGVWLQQTGCSSPQSLQLAENIIRDHFFLNTSNRSSLKSLANSAPQFVSNFITAVTELYLNDTPGTKQLPPKHLLEIITVWVYSNPALCTSAQQSAAALPSGAIPMAAVTPLAGLVRWCARAPLHAPPDAEMVEVIVPIKKIKIEDQSDAIIKTPPPTITMTESELYIKLHLGVLQSLRAGRRPLSAPTAVSAQHLAALALALRHSAAAPDVLQECLDRLGQAVQVALAHGCVFGNVSSLLAALEALPASRLLRLVVRQHRQLV